MHVTGTSVMTREPKANMLGSKISGRHATIAVVKPNIRRAETQTRRQSPTAKLDAAIRARDKTCRQSWLDNQPNTTINRSKLSAFSAA